MSGGRGAAIFGGLAVVVAISIVARVDARAQRRRAAAAIDEAIPTQARDGFVGSGACRSCHPGAYATWHDSFHRTMTQRATPTAVIGRFDGEPLPDGTRPVRDGEAFAFDAPERSPVVMTTGAHHMQVYWVPADDGSLRAARWAWLRDEDGDDGRWVPNAATLVHPPGTEEGFTWNRVCIKCHAVAGAPGWDATSGVVTSSVAELGIACEACHGPGARHVQVNRDPVRRWAKHVFGDDDGDPTIVQPARLTAAAATEVCAQCHSITVLRDEDAWIASGRSHPVIDPASHPALESWARMVHHPLLADQPWIDPVLDEEPEFFAQRFWADGMVRVSGREANGIVQSPCFAGGELSCLSCHRMHGAQPDDQLAPGMAGDDACTQCHAASYRSAAHTHHPAEAAGCMDCHMPHTTYGLLKAIRSHTIDSPNATTSAATGRPLACDLCHLDRSPAWSAQALAQWYGHAIPSGLPDDVAASAIGLLAGDAGQRALWAWHFGWSPAQTTGGHAWAVPLLARLLDDPYPAVRLVAARALGSFAPGGVDPLIDGQAAMQSILEDVRGSDREGAHLLLRPDGTPDDVAIATWLSRRDDRPVLLAE